MQQGKENGRRETRKGEKEGKELDRNGEQKNEEIRILGVQYKINWDLLYIQNA